MKLCGTLFGKKIYIYRENLYNWYYGCWKPWKSDFFYMVEQLTYQLRKERWLTSTVVIKVRYVNFDTETKQCKVAHTAADHTLSKSSFRIIQKGIPEECA